MTLLAFVAFACKRVDPGPQASPPAPVRASISVHIPAKLSSVETGEYDSQGKPIRVSCISCHSQRPIKPLPNVTSDLREFHVGLTLQHGALRCASCHQEGDTTALHLASGEHLAMVDALKLCAQCHGPQYRDYQRFAHGGASGYWNHTLGPTVRNHCVDCHDPHAPRYPGALPVLAPRDRIPPVKKEAEHG